MKSTKVWLIALGLLGLLALVALVWLPQLRKDGELVELVQDGVVLQTLPLNENKSLRVLTADGKGYNFVSIKDGMVSVTDASCPDQVCVKKAPTRERGNPIVCLPNRLVVQVRGGATETLDGVTG